MQCLTLIDLQNDFMPGGALAVPHGDEVLSVANRLGSGFDYVVASQDWHPADHGSFASQHAGRKPGEMIQLAGVDQVLWPDHCVQDTPGSAFHADLDLSMINEVFRKGTHREVDSYSAFFDNARLHSTGLGEHLRGRGLTQLCMVGLATDYCVKFSALDALSLGFEVKLVLAGCRGIDVAPGDTELAIQAMRNAGVKVVTNLGD